MRILLGHSYYRTSAPSGEDVVYENEKQLLINNGIDVLTYEKRNDDINEQGALAKLSLATNTVWSRRAYREVTTTLRRSKPDIAHFHNTFPQISPSVYAACKDHGIPVVQTLHNFRFLCAAALLQRNNRPCEDCVGASLWPAIKNRCYRGSLLATLPLVTNIQLNHKSGKVSRLIDRYIALTEFARSRFVRGGVPKEKIVIKPNFVSDPELNSSNLGTSVVFVGRLTAEKGVRTLIRAWRSIKDIPLKIVGDGELRYELERDARSHDANIEFLGGVKKIEVLDIVRRSRFVVVPSSCYEGFPMAILEAYACRKPVIGAAIGSLNEIIIRGETGEHFSPEDSSALALAVTSLWNDDARTRILSAGARRFYEECFTPSRNFQQLLGIYEAVIRQ